ncbi:MAG TPA: hypothetical protein VGO47_11025 [Chlamydiales bacterium]|nr:hypothetical protein [Chlamydiales bacterium]
MSESNIIAGMQTYSVEYPPTPTEPISTFEMPAPPVPVYSWSATGSPSFEHLFLSSHAPISTSTASPKVHRDPQSEAWIHAAPVPSSSQAILHSISSGSDILIQRQNQSDTNEYLAPLVELTSASGTIMPAQPLIFDWFVSDLPNVEPPSFPSYAPVSTSNAPQSVNHDPQSHSGIQYAGSGPSSFEPFSQSYPLNTHPHSSVPASALPVAHAPQKRKRAVEETQSQAHEKRQRRQVSSNARVNTGSCPQPPTVAPQAHHIPSSSQPFPLPYLIPSHPDASTLPQPVAAAPLTDRAAQKRKEVDVLEDTLSQWPIKRELSSTVASVSVSGANTGSYPRLPLAALQPLDPDTEKRKGKQKPSREEGASEAPVKRQRRQTASGLSAGGEPAGTGWTSATLGVSTSTGGSTSAVSAATLKRRGRQEPAPQQKRYYCEYINPVTGRACVGQDGMPRSYVERRNFRRHYKSKHARQEDRDVKNGILEREKVVALKIPWCNETAYTCRVSECRYPAEHGGQPWQISTYNRTEKDIAKHKRIYHPQLQRDT